MTKQLKTQQTSGVALDPDDIGARNPTKPFVVITLLSLIACWAVPNFLTSFVLVLTPIFWIVFHIAYVGLLLGAYLVAMRRYKAARR